MMKPPRCKADGGQNPEPTARAPCGGEGAHGSCTKGDGWQGCGPWAAVSRVREPAEITGGAFLCGSQVFGHDPVGGVDESRPGIAGIFTRYQGQPASPVLRMGFRDPVVVRDSIADAHGQG